MELRTKCPLCRDLHNNCFVEKAEIEAKRVQQESESKLKDETLKQYKEQLSRLVKELQAERREKREASEKGLEQLRLQYLAREERYILDGDRQELRSIKDEERTIPSYLLTLFLSLSIPLNLSLNLCF